MRQPFVFTHRNWLKAKGYVTSAAAERTISVFPVKRSVVVDEFPPVSGSAIDSVKGTHGRLLVPGYILTHSFHAAPPFGGSVAQPPVGATPDGTAANGADFALVGSAAGSCFFGLSVPPTYMEMAIRTLPAMTR